VLLRNQHTGVTGQVISASSLLTEPQIA